MSNKQNQDDIVYEEESGGESFEKKLKKVKSDLKKCQKEKEEYLDGWQRSKADYINLKKRSEEEKASLKDYAKEDIILQIIPTIDNFDMAFKDKEAWEKAPEVWRQGIEHIYNQLMGVLSDNGVTVDNPLGEDFDPNKHHSRETVKVEDEAKDGKVVEILQKGYLIKGRVIREATVKVGEYFTNK